MTEPATRVAALGLATVDMVQRVDALPGPNQKVWALDASLDLGGPAANAAATAAALGVDARLVAAIGGSALGRLLVEPIERAGLELVDLAPVGFAPPISTVLVPRASGERAVVSVNAKWAGEVRPLPDGVLDGVHACLVDGHLMGRALEFAAAAKQAGVPVVLDGGSWKPGTPALLGSTTVAVVSADFVVPELGPGAAPETVLAFLAGKGARWAAITNGGDPVVVRWSNGQMERLPVPPVPDGQVVDTLGAGDVLHGALLAELAGGIGRGLELDDHLVRAGLTRAIAVARESVMTPGARGWVR